EVGGSERQLVALIGGLPKDRFECHIVCLSGFGELEGAAREAGATLYDLGYRRRGAAGQAPKPRFGALLAICRLSRILRRLRPDVLHTLIPVCNILGIAASRLVRVPHVVCTRLALGAYRDQSRAIARLEDWSDRRFQLIHCKSQGILEDIAGNGVVPRDRMRVVYNGLDPARFGNREKRSDLRNEFQIPWDVPVVGMVANLIGYKGHREVIAAAPGVLRVFPQARFLFVGRDDGIQGDLTRQAAELGIGDSIVFAGLRQDIPDLMASMDVLVSASHQEGFSNVIIEAMASFLPVVATRVGGSPEAVEDGLTGYIVPPGSSKAIEEAILSVLRSDDQGKLMGQAGRDRVVDRFSYEAMIEGMVAFYGELGQR
ncbi:MAG: glycosyltransferase, partial [Candidatus Sumerlaeaceae bacterium]|nr:glycosyltransferase [Candidatus Sumerlaeaceae bacterium]